VVPTEVGQAHRRAGVIGDLEFRGGSADGQHGRSLASNGLLAEEGLL
jgi:hypothetical protein